MPWVLFPLSIIIFFFLSQINASPCQSVYLEKKTDKRLLFTHYHYQSVQCVAFFKAGMEPHHAIFLQQFETSNRVFIRHNNLSLSLSVLDRENYQIEMKIFRRTEF